MSERTPQNKEQGTKPTQTSSESPLSAASRNKALLISISTAVLLVVFAVVTLFRTDFDTYPEDVDITLVTQAPSSLVSKDDRSTPTARDKDYKEAEKGEDEDEDEDEDNISSDNEDEDDMDVLIAAGETTQLAQDTLRETTVMQREQIQMLSASIDQLQQDLKDKTGIITYLNRELDAAKEYVQQTAGSESSTQDADLANEYHDLQQAHNRLKQELQAARSQIERSSGDNPEIQERLSHLRQREEALHKENAQLEDRITVDQQKFAQQEKTFRELRGALRTHKEALRRMDQSRIELAAELDATKSQYAKLLQAVASRAKTNNSIAEIDALVASAKEASQASLDEQRQADKRYHVVKKGDTLSGISRHYYGSAQRWHEIYEANQAMLNDQNRLKVGLVLVIP